MLPSMLEPSPVQIVLAHHAVPALRRIHVDETETTVVLTGVVLSFYYKQLAQEAVVPLLAGRKLCNHLEVVRP